MPDIPKLSPSSDPTAASALDKLHAELAADQQKQQQQSYVGRAVSAVTQRWHHADSNEAAVQNLADQIQKQVASGNDAQATQLAQKAQTAIAADQAAQQTQSSIASYGGDLVTAVGLFMGGKWAMPTTAVAFAANTARPSDSLGKQATEAALGSAQGVFMKGTMDMLGKTNLGIASKAVLMGSSARLAQLTFSPDTYTNPSSGNFDLGTGLKNIASGTLDPKSLASDIVVFGVAGLALGKLDSATDGWLSRSRLASNVATGTLFGVTSGSVSEIQREENAEQKFDLGKVLKSALITGGIDGIAAIPGGIQGRIEQNAAGQSARLSAVPDTARDASTASTAGDASATDTTLGAQPANKFGIGRAFPGSNSREFQIVLSDGSPATKLEASKSGWALVRAREVNADGTSLGDPKNILIQHLDNQTPIRANLAAKADLIASCNPDLLGEFRSKHLFPETSGTLTLSEKGTRLGFTMEPVPDTNGTQWRSVQLGYPTVSELLKDPDTAQRLRVSHDRNLDTIARQMQHFKQPALRFIDGGGDSLVFEMANHNILKITDREWRPEWGYRTYTTPGGNVRPFDARMLTEPQEIDLGDKSARYYIQQRAITPVSLEHMDWFSQQLDRDGTYQFWDNDWSNHGQNQLGYVRLNNGKNRIVVLDYNSVLPPNEVPKVKNRDGSAGSGPSWMRSDYAEFFDR